MLRITQDAILGNIFSYTIVIKFILFPLKGIITSQKKIPNAAYKISDIMIMDVAKILTLPFLIFCDFGSFFRVSDHTSMMVRMIGMRWTPWMMNMQQKQLMVNSFCLVVYLEQCLSQESNGDKERGAFAGEQHIDWIHQHGYEIKEWNKAFPDDACNCVILDEQGEDSQYLINILLHAHLN